MITYNIENSIRKLRNIVLRFYYLLKFKNKYTSAINVITIIGSKNFFLFFFFGFCFLPVFFGLVVEDFVRDFFNSFEYLSFKSFDEDFLPVLKSSSLKTVLSSFLLYPNFTLE